MFVRSIHQPEKIIAPKDPAAALDPLYVCWFLGCAQIRRPGQILCRAHWFELSDELRGELMECKSDWLAGNITWPPYQAARFKALIHLCKLHGEDSAKLEARLAEIQPTLQPRTDQGLKPLATGL
jgi:hypothetical protein